MKETDYIKQFLHDRGIEKLPRDEQLMTVIHAVSKIPWGEARTVEEVYQKNKGTCTGKHKFLQAALDYLGFSYIPVVCTFRWGEQGITYPAHLQSILDEGEWEHGHNFIQIPRLEDEKMIDVDITWNPELKPYGFSILPEDWDGKTSFVGLKKIVRRWDNANIDDMKKELIANLSPEMKERRERFLHACLAWVDSVNAGRST